MATYLPIPGFKGRMCKLCVLTRWNLISASAAPHCKGEGEREREREEEGERQQASHQMHTL